MSVDTSSLFDMQYHLDINSVDGEGTPSDDQLKFAKCAFSILKQAIIDEILNHMSTDNKDYLSRLRKASWMEHFDLKDYEMFYTFEVPIENEENFIAIISRLSNQILTFTNILVDLRIFMNSEMVQDYIRCFMMTKLTEVDYKSAALFLVEKSGLSIEYKYKIACYFCLKKQVYELVINLPLEYVNKFLQSSTEIAKCLTLWYFCAQNQMSSFNKVLFKLKDNKKQSNEDYLMLLALRDKNEFAVQCIFEKYFGISCHYKLPELIKYALQDGSTNIVCYLISKMRSCDLIKQLCIEEGHNILKMLLNDPKWRSYFLPTSNYVLQYIDKMNFICSLRTLIFCWIGNESERNSYNLYINGFISKFEVDMNKRLFQEVCIKVLILISELNNRKNLNTLLRIGCSVDCVRLFDINIMREIGTELILAQKIHILKKFIKDHCNAQEEKDFKSRFLKTTYFKICSILILSERFQELDEYLETFYEFSIFHFKETIPYLRGGKIFERVMLSAQNVTKVQHKVNRVLLWCFNGDQTGVEFCINKFLINFQIDYPSSFERFNLLIKKIKKKKTNSYDFVESAYSDAIWLRLEEERLEEE